MNKERRNAIRAYVILWRVRMRLFTYGSGDERNLATDLICGLINGFVAEMYLDDYLLASQLFSDFIDLRS